MMQLLSRSDELVLLAVWKLKDSAYGVPVREFLIETTGADWSIGAVYDSLERLALKGYVTSEMSDPSPERGGRRKRFFSLTGDGIAALKHTKKIHERVWNEIPGTGLDTV